MYLITRPASVTWVYEQRIKSTYVGDKGQNLGQSSIIYIHEANKKVHTLQLKPMDVPKVMDALKVFLPSAIFGYSDENKKNFG